MNELGMVYAANGNVVEYDSPTSDYVKQYNEIPSDGILAKSKDVSKIGRCNDKKTKKKIHFNF